MRHKLLRLIWFVFAALVVSIAVALSAARILLPQMSAYKQELESVSAHYLNKPVQIGTLNATWQGMSPVLRLQQVVVEDERLPGGRLAVAEVQVVFDILDSLRKLQWRMAGIELIGLQLQVEVGKQPLPPLARLLAPFRWLLQQGSIVLRQVRFDVTDSRFGKKPMELELLQLRLVNTGPRHQLLVEGQLPAALGGAFKLAADVVGQVEAPETWNGRTYLRGTAISLDILQSWFTKLSMTLAGEADAELWLDIKNGQFEQMNGSLTARNLLHLVGGEDDADLGRRQLAANFRLLRSDHDWQLALSGFELAQDGVPVWPATNGFVTISPGPATSFRGHVSHVVLREVQRILPLLPWIDSRARKMLDDLNVTGVLDDVEFDLELVPDRAPRFSARASFESLSVVSTAELPDIRNLSGSIEGNLQSGFVTLDAAGSVLSMPGVFPRELQLDLLSGTLRWQRFRDMFRIESQKLQLVSGPLRAVAKTRVDWPYGQTPWLDLRVALQSFPLEQVRNFLPGKIMKPKPLAWLKRAFAEGTARDARFLFQGRIDEVPFDQNEGRLEARFDFDHVELDFHPTWGTLEELSGSASFVGRSMTISGETGRIMDSPVEHVVVRIDDLKQPLLEITGTVSGTLAGMLQYVEVSPLGERFGKLLQELDAEGDANLQLNIDVPLVPGLGAVRVDGTVTLDGNALRSDHTDLPLDKLHGTLNFTNEGISADRLQASLLGQPVSLSVYQQGERNRAETVVDVRGKLQLVQALKKSGSPFGAYVDGSADWVTRLFIRNRPADSERGVILQLQSDLVGVSSRLPAPFAKSAQDRRELRIEWVPGTELPFSVSYADRADARILLNRDWTGLRRVAVAFGDPVAVLPDLDQIHLSGKLEQLDVAAWIAVFTQGTAGGQAVPPLAVDVEIGSLQLFGYEVRNVAVVSRPQDPWYFLLKGEGALGWVRWVPGGVVRPGRLLANLDVLVLENLPHSGASGSRPTLHPQDLPELELRATDLDWGGRKLGEVGLTSSHIEDGTSFDSIEMNSEAAVFAGKGAWKEYSGQQVSEFSATLSGGDLGKLLYLFGDQDSIKGGAITQAAVQLNWPGSPADFNLEHIEGDATIKVVDGRLDTVKEGAGKLLHLISLNSLQRRLTLDFSDLFKEGFSFDKLRGHFVIADGNAYTDGFKIDGPSAIIEISGRTGLAARDYDQLVTVTPQVSSSLPIAGAIAGGPVVGAAVLLVERLMGEKFNRMVQVQYQVTGSWDNPEYTRLERESTKTETEPEINP